jgi:FMN phosphatase YigB (HAD superfamily)
MFIIDLDSTLYKSHNLGAHCKKVFLSFGIDSDVFESSSHRAVHGANGDYFDYSFENHIDLLSQMGHVLPKEELLKKLNEIFEENHVMDDAFFFLESLKKTNKKLLLLTAGNKDFQYKKIENAQIEKYFDEIVVVHGQKEKFIEENVQKEGKIFFINDNLKENKKVKECHPDVVVLTKRNARKNTEEEWEQSGIPHFETLTEILNYIEIYG